MPNQSSERADSPYRWDAGSRRYRDTRTGRYLAQGTIHRLREQLVSRDQAAYRDLAGRLTRGDLTVAAWERGMRDLLRRTHTMEYLLGRGGRRAMTPADWGSLGHTLRDQYRYLHDFADQVSRGELTPARITARATHYADASRQSHERGRGAAMGLTLPAYPGDGSSPCHGRCRCHWTYRELRDEWRCTWTRTANESCHVCVTRAETWSPLVIPKPAAAD